MEICQQLVAVALKVSPGKLRCKLVTKNVLCSSWFIARSYRTYNRLSAFVVGMPQAAVGDAVRYLAWIGVDVESLFCSSASIDKKAFPLLMCAQPS